MESNIAYWRTGGGGGFERNYWGVG